MENFNGLIVWGLIEYPKLHTFFMTILKFMVPKFLLTDIYLNL